ncbi:MAG: SDR family NAD(P)-dependent oxidoreductase [Colwellia sp.]
MTKKSMANENVSPVEGKNDEQEFNSKLQACPIAVVGMASIFADAKNLADYWDNIFESVDAIKDVPAEQWAIDDYYDSDPSVADKSYCKRGGFLPEIDFDPMEFGLPPNILELTDITQLLSLVVARDVINDAGIGDDSGYDRDKVGVVLGVGGGQKQAGMLTSRLQGPVLEKVLKASGIDDEDSAVIIDKFKKAYVNWEENSFPGLLGNVIAGRIANRFDLGGTNCVVDAACAGSLAAIKLAISDLLEYRSEVMISGGVCCDNSPFMYMSFSKTPAFTTGDDIRPFDNDSKGMMIGEGIGMMAFKRLEDAERDGDKIYAVLKGIGTSSDGRFKSIYAPRPDGQAKALKRAYEDAGFEPKSCGLIEAHGTGTKAGDAAEFSGLMKHFSMDNEQKQHIALGSVKSQIGHAKAAAGAAGMIKAVLALHHKVLPATLHIDQPNTALDIENSPMYLNSETRPWMVREDGLPRRAGISSFGFGGTNYHMVLEEYSPTATGKYRLNAVPQTILITADNEAALITCLQRWQTKLAVDTDAQPYVFNALITECSLHTPESELARCGFVAKNANEASSMIEAALKQFLAKTKTKTKTNDNDINAWSTPSGIYYRKTGLAVKGKVVALFSGQGSQYVNMGRELACNFPSVMQVAQAMDTEFSIAGLGQLSPTTYPIPVFNKEARKAQDEALRLTQHAQPAIGTFSVGLYKTFANAGFNADFTAGHSFGELTALWAAGVLNDQDYMMLARSRGQAMAAPSGEKEQNFDAGAMIAVVGNPADVAADIENIKDISIANYNSNNQVVVAGVTRQIAIAIDVLNSKAKAKGYKVVPLPVSAAFHTPLVGHAQKPFADAIDKATFNKPVVPVYSNGTAKVHSNKTAEIKNSLKKHILESVHFNEEIDNIYGDGGRIFVEFGPKNVLTKLVENILADKDDVIAISVNANPKKSADLQMRQAAVQMSVLGLSLNNVDPYSAIKRPLVAPKKSPLAMKLTGASYVSDKTKQAFDEALNDGWTIKQATSVPVTVSEPKVIERVVEKEIEKVVEKIVEVERIVEVEKIVYLTPDGKVFNGKIAEGIKALTSISTPANNVGVATNVDLTNNIERSVSQFVEHQQQLLSVHQQYMQGPKDYAKTFDTVLSAQKGKALPDSLDRTLSMYHNFQTETLRVHEQYLTNQTESMTAILSVAQQSVSAGQALTVSYEPVASNAVTSQAVVGKAVSKQTVNQPVQTVVTAVDIAPIVEENVVSVISSEPSFDVDKIETVMMTVVAEKTGYPTEMLELDMDMEADLGIDSIKRVEILGAVQEIISTLPELNPEDLAELRTLGEIVAYMQSKVTNTQVSSSELSLAKCESELANESAPTIDTDYIQQVMMAVVAEKTGYPTEMLELDMDMEADLGIDSIKRVEILGAVQETIPMLPELNPEDLAELRTLGEIVGYMQSKVTNTQVSNTQVSSSELSLAKGESELVNESALAIDADYIQQVMMAVVAEKTGYPTEMLELDMDMEADLGIDSIKRVEILGAVQEIISTLPELNPEDLAELRTLGEIVGYMQSKVTNIQIASDEVLSEVSSSELSLAKCESELANESALAIDADYIQQVMMTVVAEKTGYPTEMLELDMDMEADLGIDSIKRVEILGAVQETILMLPELSPEDLAELRTLGEIVGYMQSKVSNIQVSNTQASNTQLSNDELRVASNNVLSDALSEVSSELAIDTPFQGAPSATVTLTALPSVNKIVQNFANKEAGANALIVDDGTGSAVALSEKLIKAGWNVTALKPNWVEFTSKKSFANLVKVIDVGSIDNTIDEAEIAGIIQDNETLDAVIYMQAPNTLSENKGDVIEYPQAAKQGLMLAFVLAKLCKLNDHQVKNINKARASFVVVTRQGGTLGFTHNSDSAQASVDVSGDVKADIHADLVQAGLAGLVKTLSHEWQSSLSNEGNGVFCRVIDLSVKLAADKAATIISDELLDIETSIIEVAHDTDNLSQNNSHNLSYNIGSRLTLAGVATDSYSLAQGNSIDSNSVFLVSGGAKGVTAHCVIEIAKQYQSKFILLGRSPYLDESLDGSLYGGLDRENNDNEPSWAQGICDEASLKKAAMQALVATGEKPTPAKVSQFIRPILANREIAQTLTAISAAGGQAKYVAADVTNSASVSAAVTSVIKDFGSDASQVTGIIHGAGVLADKFIEQKTLAEFNAVYSTKIEGLLSLLAATNTENIKHLVLFSSAAGFYGNPGQSDYSMANDILNKTAYRFKALHPSTQVLSFNWGPWDGGMVTPELKRMFDERGVYIIPLDAGAKLLVSELAAKDNRCAQILVGNDLSKEQSKEQSKKQPKDNSEAGTFVKKSQVSRLTISVTKTLQATNNAFLADHVIGGDKVLPTVCAIAWMREAATAAYQGYHYQGFTNYKLFKGIVFKGSIFKDSAFQSKFDDSELEHYQIEMNAEIVGDSLLVATKVSSKIISDDGQEKTVFHYGAQLTLVRTLMCTLSKFDNQSAKQKITIPDSGDNAAELYTNGTLFHGESLQGITEILECNEQGLLLSCQVPQMASAKQGDFPLSSLNNRNVHRHSNIFANDLAYQAMLVWVKKQLGLGSLPSSTDSWTVYREVDVGERFYLQLTVVKSTGKGKKRGSLIADIQFFTAEKDNKPYQLLSEIKSAKVTASTNLNDLFLPKGKVENKACGVDA